MSTIPCPEIQEVGGRNRPWSIGSQLLGHYDTRPENHTHITPENQLRPYSPNSAATDIYDGSSQFAQSEVLGARDSNRSSISPPTDGSLDDQRPLIRASTTFYDRVLTDWWWWELFSWLVSFSCVATIVGVLAFFDGKRQPEFVIPGITLNAFVAVFAAVAKAALILPVSEAIGQLKWIWFQKQSKLYDFFTFDGASRGPWGALMLLGTTKGRHLVSLGAAITLLSLAFEPFFQQIVSFPARDVSKSISTVAIATTYHADDVVGYSSPGGASFPPGISRALYLSISDAIYSRNASLRPSPSVCPTGRCNWTTYSSLGVCHRCADLSNVLKYICRKNLDMRLGGEGSSVANACGFQYNNTLVVGTGQYKQQNAYGLSVMTVSKVDTHRAQRGRWNSTVFGDPPHSILDFYVAFTPGGEPAIRQNATPILKECLLHWCVKSFQSVYENGVLREQLTGTYAEVPVFEGLQRNMSGSPAFEITSGGKSFKIPQNATFTMGQVAYANLPDVFSNQHTDSTGQYPGKWNFVQNAPYDLNYVLDSITEAMTNNIRSRPSGTEDVPGIAWATENFVEIRWPWITLPGVLLMGTFLFVCATVFKSRQGTAWKSSALATLLHGLSEEARDQIQPKASPSEIEAMSQKLQVRLSLQGGSTRLVLA